jgi:GntR family transcriptional regulator
MSSIREILFNGIVINKDSNVPVYLQLTHQIKSLIQSGKLAKGDRLPPERDLAILLKISRNRVGAAYRELENEGIISSQQGRGTFVEGIQDIINMPSFDATKLNLFIDLAMEEALEQNMSFDEFLAIVDKKVFQKKNKINHMKLVFIECNNEQLHYFSKKLQGDYGNEIIPIMITELERNKSKLIESNFILTTVSHYDQVCKYLRRNNIDKEVIPLSLSPNRNSLVRIAKIPDGTRIGIVTKSRIYINMIKRYLPETLVNFSDIKTNCKENGDSLKNFFDNIDCIIASSSRIEEIEGLKPKDLPLIDFVFEFDQGSLVALNSRLHIVKKTKN